MPIYDLRCEDSECNQVDEVMCKYEDIGNHNCSKCDGKTKALVGGADFRLKGPNWPDLERQNTKNWGTARHRYEKD